MSDYKDMAVGGVTFLWGATVSVLCLGFAVVLIGNLSLQHEQILSLSSMAEVAQFRAKQVEGRFDELTHKYVQTMKTVRDQKITLNAQYMELQDSKRYIELLQNSCRDNGIPVPKQVQAGFRLPKLSDLFQDTDKGDTDGEDEA